MSCAKHPKNIIYSIFSFNTEFALFFNSKDFEEMAARLSHVDLQQMLH